MNEVVNQHFARYLCTIPHRLNKHGYTHNPKYSSPKFDNYMEVLQKHFTLE